MYKYISKNEESTIKLAQKIASQLNIGDIIVLTGELGAGKTKFVQGILRYFNLENEISSPTFTIVNEYQAKNINIYHFDVYRLSNIDEFYAIGGDEYFHKGVCIIEWGEIIKETLPNNYINIEFQKDSKDDNTRILNIQVFGDKILDFEIL